LLGLGARWMEWVLFSFASLPRRRKAEAEGPVYSALFLQFYCYRADCPWCFWHFRTVGLMLCECVHGGQHHVRVKQQIPVAWTATGRHRGLKKPDGVKGCRRRRISYDTQAIATGFSQWVLYLRSAPVGATGRRHEARWHRSQPSRGAG
jgi:hypothetical protein